MRSPQANIESMATHTIKIYDAELDVGEEEVRHLLDAKIIYEPARNEGDTLTYYVHGEAPIVRLPLDYGCGEMVLDRIRQAIARPDAEIRKVKAG